MRASTDSLGREARWRKPKSQMSPPTGDPWEQGLTTGDLCPVRLGRWVQGSDTVRSFPIRLGQIKGEMTLV